MQLFETLQKSQQRVRQLEHHLDLLLRRVFGKSSEKLDPQQLVLAFAELSAETAPPVTSEPPAESDAPAANTAKKQGHGRRRTPDASSSSAATATRSVPTSRWPASGNSTRSNVASKNVSPVTGATCRLPNAPRRSRWSVNNTPGRS